MKVFRIEHPTNGTGPYNEANTRRRTIISRKLCWEHNEDRKHPDPHTDLDYFSHGMLCGFQTFGDLKNWFKGFLGLLRWGGYRIAIYEADQSEVAFGKYQVGFSPNFAEKITELKIPKDLENIGNFIYSNLLLIMKTTAA